MQRIMPNKRELRKIDLDVLIRLLSILSEVNSLRMTDLQMKARTNYSTCMRYIKFLEKLGLVKLDISRSKRFISITERGKEACKILLA